MISRPCRNPISFFEDHSVDPDEMQHFVAFHLGLHCLPKYAFRSY